MATDHRVLRLGPDDQGRLVSADEFATADGVAPWKYEREGGRLLVMSPDSKDHDDCSEPLRDHLGAFRLANPQLVEDVVSESWVRVGDGTDRIADIAVYLVPDGDVPERPDRVPEIVFEIVSADRESRRRDFVAKRLEYQRLGVLEHVIIDRFRKRVTIHLQHGPREGRKRILRPFDHYTSELLPGLAIPVAEFLGA